MVLLSHYAKQHLIKMVMCHVIMKALNSKPSLTSHEVLLILKGIIEAFPSEKNH